MPIITGRSGHIDFPLSDYAVGAFNEGYNEDGFIAGQLGLFDSIRQLARSVPGSGVLA